MTMSAVGSAGVVRYVFQRLIDRDLNLSETKGLHTRSEQATNIPTLT